MIHTVYHTQHGTANIGKSSLMIYEIYGSMKFKYRNRKFWRRGYYVDTVGKNTKKIQEYIAKQLKEDQ
jgi:putative transposase